MGRNSAKPRAVKHLRNIGGQCGSPRLMSIYYDRDSFEAEQLDETRSIASIYSEDWSWTSEDGQEDQPELCDTDEKPEEAVQQVQENWSPNEKKEVSR